TLGKLAAELAKMPPESGRNSRLNDGAFKMGPMISAGWIPRSEVEKALYDACMSNGLIKNTGPRAVRATIASGLKAGLNRPPHKPLKDREGPQKKSRGGKVNDTAQQISKELPEHPEGKSGPAAFPDMTKAKPSCANARKAIQALGIECRHDLFH